MSICIMYRVIRYRYLYVSD
ncbi:hypothetical protein G210_4337 [Candida maltosa Xu316]|uniref:Uncharacterized protein n=1 Tax=Candida maltosa (strain Xu316) TaxID=1245528 RepID=M3JRR2_CANMX|nr:hypothetical protein G210_4337 [Candida maltosa Xu316]